MKTPLRSSTVAKALATAAAVALLATGCSPASSSDSSGNVTVRFTWWGNDLRNKQTQQVIDAFQASHPNIKIQAEPGVWSSYWDKLAAARCSTCPGRTTSTPPRSTRTPSSPARWTASSMGSARDRTPRP